MLGEEGVYHAAREGLIHADFSTVHPKVSRELAEAGRKRGIRVLDAAMTRSVPQAEAGTLGLLVGGAPEDLEACRPGAGEGGLDHSLLRAERGRRDHEASQQPAGRHGRGPTIEALLLGVKAGLTPELMLSVFATTAANNGTLEPLIRGRVLKREIESPVFALNLQYKDARLALELASDVEAAMPVSAVVQQLRAAVRAKGRGGWDSSAVVTVFEELNNAELLATEP